MTATRRRACRSPAARLRSSTRPSPSAGRPKPTSRRAPGGFSPGRTRSRRPGRMRGSWRRGAWARRGADRLRGRGAGSGRRRGAQRDRPRRRARRGAIGRGLLVDHRETVGRQAWTGRGSPRRARPGQGVVCVDGDGLGHARRGEEEGIESGADPVETGTPASLRIGGIWLSVMSCARWHGGRATRGVGMGKWIVSLALSWRTRL